MFSPGTVISEFTSKKGKQVVLRLPVQEDVDSLLDYINTLSREDTFITLSGEQFSLEEERKFVEDRLAEIRDLKGMTVLAVENEKVVGISSITRYDKRSKHVGFIGLSIAKDYREEGLGTELLSIIVDLARKLSFQMAELTVHANNESAIHVYQKAGFNEVGRIPKKILHKDQLVDEVIMVKFL